MVAFVSLVTVFGPMRQVFSLLVFCDYDDEFRTFPYIMGGLSDIQRYLINHQLRSDVEQQMDGLMVLLTAQYYYYHTSRDTSFSFLGCGVK